MHTLFTASGKGVAEALPRRGEMVAPGYGKTVELPRVAGGTNRTGQGVDWNSFNSGKGFIQQEKHEVRRELCLQRHK